MRIGTYEIRMKMKIETRLFRAITDMSVHMS